MKKIIYLPLACALFLVACSSNYKKSENGMEYKIVADGSGDAIKYGEFLMMHISTEYKGRDKDSLLNDSREYMPVIKKLDSTNFSPIAIPILLTLRKGDSLIMRVPTDSMFKGQQMPPFMEKGAMVYTKVKVLKIIKTDQEAETAYMEEMKKNRSNISKKEIEDFNAKMDQITKSISAEQAQIDKDSKVIEAYLAKNNIKATRTKLGVYIEVKQEGTGNVADPTCTAIVNYTGKTLDSSKVFDSNTDPKFGHMQPYPVAIGMQLGSVIIGWTDALLQMKKGEKATIYIPSTLGYGKQGNMPKINPDAILVFDMEIVDVKTEAQVLEEQQAAQAQLKEKEEALRDSLKKAK